MKKHRFLQSFAILTPLVGLAIALPASPSHAQSGPKISLRDPSHEAVVETNVMIVARDGTRLAADLYHPGSGGKPAEGRFPTLLQRTPYGKGDGKSNEAIYYAKRGYNVVMNDVRGRYASEGKWRLIADDPQDGFDVVEWIAGQAWSDGKIGTFGTSYPGGTQHALAELNPPHLTTMIPIDSVSNCGIGGMRQGGAFELRFMNWIYVIGAPASRPALASQALRGALQENGRLMRRHVYNLPVRTGNSPLRAAPEYEAWIVEAMQSGPESAFWKIKGMSVVDHVQDYADVPVLHVTGWYDSWTRSVALSYQALSKAKRSPQRLLIGPWVHGSQGSNVSGEVEFSADAAIDLLALRLRWYDRWMKNEKNGVDDDPPVLIYVMGTGDDHKTSAGKLAHGGHWRSEKEWPPARARETAFYLHGDGTLRAQASTRADDSTTYTFDPRHPVPTIGGNISSNAGLMTNGGYDQRPRTDTLAQGDLLPLSERNDVLVFRTEPLALDLEATGVVQVKLWIKSTAPDTDFTAKLIDEIPPCPDHPVGFDLNIADSILRCRYRESLDKAKLMTPGETYPITIELYPTSNVFKKGHRIRLDVSSSNFPRFDTNPNTGDELGKQRRYVTADNTVFHDGSHPSRILLPVIRTN